MRPSPGEQRQSRTLSPTKVLLALALALPLLWLWNTKHPSVQEYRLYLAEDRKALDLPWADLSGAWTESQVKTRLRGFPVRCGTDHTGAHSASRSCGVDLKGWNGIPTMYVNFIFADDQLVRVASGIPWWSYHTAKKELVRSLGQPQATQDRAHSGVRLHGWTTASGATLFFNADLPVNPLEPNSVQWLSPTICDGKPCISP